jgi:TusA-related sulfurtransferase
MRGLHAPDRLAVSAHLVDARGRACPQPIIDLARALKLHPFVELWADDPAAHADLIAFCEATGHALVPGVAAGVPLRALINRRGSTGPQI